MPLPQHQKGIVVLPLLIFILAVITVALASFVFLDQNQVITHSADSTSQPKAGLIQRILSDPAPTPTPNPWMSYDNPDYNFRIIYPREGVVYQADGSRTGGFCGGSIIEDPKNAATILVDNFFKLKIVAWDSTLADYLVSTGGSEAYNIEAIVGSGADEAVKLLGLKPDFEVAVGYPPLAYIKAVYKKGGNIFLMQEVLHNPANPGGCVVPAIVDPSKFSDIASQQWDITTSIKFNE